MQLVDTVTAWFLAKDWRTWLSHVLLAAVIGLVVAVLLRSALAARLALTVPWGVALEFGFLLGVLVYWVREGMQVYQQARTEGRRAVHAHALDHGFDMIAPFLALGLLSLFLR